MDHDDDRPLNVLDAEAGRLREQHTGWRIWYVRNPVARIVNWYASPGRYPLSAMSPAELSALIDADPAGE